MSEEKTELELRFEESVHNRKPMGLGEYCSKVTKAVKEIRASGREPTKEEILEIKIRVNLGEEEEAVMEPTRQQKIEARVTELIDLNTRRGLEEIARGMGFEPTKTEHPNMTVLAKAIAEKEFPEEAEAPLVEEDEPHE